MLFLKYLLLPGKQHPGTEDENSSSCCCNGNVAGERYSEEEQEKGQVKIQVERSLERFLDTSRMTSISQQWAWQLSLL